MLASEDHNIFSKLALGGTGAIAASAHLHTPAFAQLVRALKDEQTETWEAHQQAQAQLARY